MLYWKWRGGGLAWGGGKEGWQAQGHTLEAGVQDSREERPWGVPDRLTALLSPISPEPARGETQHLGLCAGP